jgi:hypothetical protein
MYMTLLYRQTPERGCPSVIGCNNRPEFISGANVTSEKTIAQHRYDANIKGHDY